MKRLAEDVAEDCAGVRNVQNRLRVDKSNGAEKDGSASRDEGSLLGSSSGVSSSGSSTSGSSLSGSSTSGFEKSPRSRGDV
jgi:hypothetical protein